LEGRIKQQALVALLADCFMLVSCLAYSQTLNMEATCSSETSVDVHRITVLYPRRQNSSLLDQFFFPLNPFRDFEPSTALIFNQPRSTTPLMGDQIIERSISTEAKKYKHRHAFESVTGNGKF
jgi:hypothetical protein